jgi:hypothetical protein
MLKRIFITIRRGITDATAVCVFPWEKPLIEEIHSGNATLVTIDQMCSKDGVKSVKKLKLHNTGRRDQDDKPMAPEYAPDTRAQLEAMTNVDPDNNPMDDPAGEYARMAEKYGMHPKIELTVVEKVFGNERTFRSCMRDFAAGRTPDFLMEDDGEQGEKIVAEMTAEELRVMLDGMGVKFPPKATRAKLEEIAVEAQAQQAA